MHKNLQYAVLEPLEGLTHLESLYVSNNALDDLSALAGLTNLKSLTLTDNHIRDLSPLSGLHNLEELRLSSNCIEDLSPLANLPRLRLLILDSNPIQDITPLSGLDSLTRLSLAGTKLTWDGWEPVKGLPNVDGRPAIENAGISPCPQEWVDRIHAAYPDGSILTLDYDDYDGDGSYEAFALVADWKTPSQYTSDGYGGSFLLVTPKSIEELYSRDHGLLPGEYFRFGNRKVVSLNYINPYSSSVSLLWTVDGTSPRSMNLSSRGQYFHVDSEGNICMLHSTYDGASDQTGHSYKPYYFYYDGNDFVEYGAVPITIGQFLTCRGADVILKDIEHEGLTVDSILYRKNGLIHLNLRTPCGPGQRYSNSYKTLKLEGRRVTLIDQGMGYYLTAMAGIPVDSPAGFPSFP